MTTGLPQATAAESIPGACLITQPSASRGPSALRTQGTSEACGRSCRGGEKHGPWPAIPNSTTAQGDVSVGSGPWHSGRERVRPRGTQLPAQRRSEIALDAGQPVRLMSKQLLFHLFLRQ